VEHHYWPSGSVGRGNRGVDWGVKRGSVVLFPREEGTLGWRALEAAAAAAFGGFILGKKEVGWGPCGSERRGWRRVGPAGGQGPVGREASGWASEKEAAQERRRVRGPGRRERSGLVRGDGERASRRPSPRRLG
jgi:hypothetical protein